MLRKCAIFSPIYLSGRSIAATTASRASITSTLPDCPRPVFHLGSDSYAGSLDVFEQMPHRGLLRAPSDFSTFLSTCAKSGSLSAGVQAHSLILKLGLDSNVFIGSALISLYCKCSSFSEARRVFDAVPKRNVVTWNSLLYGYSNTHLADRAFGIFIEMLALEISPTATTFSSVLVACTKLEMLEMGIQIQCLGIKFGFCYNVVVWTELIHMYLKCSCLEDSRIVFDEMTERNVVTWSCMVTGYAQHQQSGEAMALVTEMRCLGVLLNTVTYTSLLSSFSCSKDLDHGKQVHGLVIREGLGSDAHVAVALITMYANCGCTEDFFKMCPSVSADQISCNSIIAGFSHLGYDLEALNCFVKMRSACVDPDYITFVSVLRAIGILSAVEEGKQIHALVLKTGYASHTLVQNGLVSMYSRCGVIEDSRKTFLSIDGPDLVSWNSLLSGCAQHGHGKEAVESFEEMRRTGITPDDTTFLSVLSACSHAGWLEKGIEYFNLMRNGNLTAAPRVEHYACVVDLLGRAGHLDEAESLIESMPIKPGASLYRALLSACRVHGNMDIAMRASKCLLELCPTDSATYVLLSNVCAAGGCWDDAAGVRKLMSDRGVMKKPGCSWIEVNDKSPMHVTRCTPGKSQISGLEVFR